MDPLALANAPIIASLVCRLRQCVPFKTAPIEWFLALAVTPRIYVCSITEILRMLLIDIGRFVAILELAAAICL